MANLKSAPISAVKAEQRADTFAELKSQLKRISFLADSSQAYLEIYRGCSVDHDDMLAAFALVQEVAAGALKSAEELKEMLHG